MSWNRVCIKLKLLSPLHIGFLPNKAGTVIAQTRCYVPGKTMWGAVTARLTPRLYPNPTAQNFRDVGDAMKKNIKFSYFYLADNEHIFTPEYSDDGLKWDNLTDKEFRRRFISSRVSTAIDNNTGGAKDETLHESEFINHQTKDKKDVIQPVFLAGVLFVQGGAKITDFSEIKNNTVVVRKEGKEEEIDIFDDISIGGDRNYGFGRVERTDGIFSIFPKDISDKGHVVIDSTKPLLGHVPYRPEWGFQGDIEVIASPDYSKNATAFEKPGQNITKPHHFVPGTKLVSSKKLEMDCWGQWNISN